MSAFPNTENIQQNMANIQQQVNQAQAQAANLPGAHQMQAMMDQMKDIALANTPANQKEKVREVFENPEFKQLITKLSNGEITQKEFERRVNALAGNSSRITLSFALIASLALISFIF